MRLSGYEYQGVYDYKVDPSANKHYLDDKLDQYTKMCRIQQARISLLENTLKKHGIKIPAYEKYIGHDYTYYKHIAEESTREYQNLLKDYRTVKAELCLLQGKQYCIAATQAINSAGGPLVFHGFASKLLGLFGVTGLAAYYRTAATWDEQQAYDWLYNTVKSTVQQNTAKLCVVVNRLIDYANERICGYTHHLANTNFDDILLAINDIARAISEDNKSATAKHLIIE